MNYMDCKALSEIAEVQVTSAIFLFALGFRAGRDTTATFAMTRACTASVMAWAIFEDSADRYLKSIPTTWTPPAEERIAA